MHGQSSQRVIAHSFDISLGSVNIAAKALKEGGLLAGDGTVSDLGMEALEQYRVENAVIMAAGLSSRFAPISYERPKGVLRVRGEVLIERQIEQLHEAGITDITLVVGYKKEEFFYLADKYGVDIVVNEEYARRNNNSTLYKVMSKLGNTYICSSDDYFTENVFEPYVYGAYYASEFAEGETDEYCLTVGAHGRITGAKEGGKDAWIMLGHAYFDRAFSKKFCEILEREYDLPETAGKLWEDIYIDHIDELDMRIRRYAPGVIHEFDSLEELRLFDPDFVENVDSEIFDNICEVLKCQRGDIRDVMAIKKGLTNMSFKFSVGGVGYVYRHAGPGTNRVINRESETFSEDVARELGLDDTFIFEDPYQGWKISRFVEECVPFDYHNRGHVQAAMDIARTLHGCGKHSKWTFDVYERSLQLRELLDAEHKMTFPDAGELHELVKKVHAHAVLDGVPSCLCHNDFYAPNFLVDDERIRLIDWEYSGESDYASDLGTFICCSDYTFEESLEVLDMYFQGEMTEAEKCHCLGYVCISSYYWFIWALYQDASGNPVGEYLYHWYRCTKKYGDYALAAYGER